ncbi:hypothetical protein OAL67_01030 [bacterium]|nr:hypothetical protein [bacterium]
MTKKPQTIYMSFIPLLLIIGIILGAGYMLLQGEIKLPKFNKGPQIRRLEGFPTVIYTSTPIEKQRLVIDNETDLYNFLNMVDETGLLTIRETIDFEKEVVLAVASETEKEVGHEIKIRKVYEDKNDPTLLVSIREMFPGETCELEIDEHVAVDVVTISKTDYGIEFERIKQYEECD